MTLFSIIHSNANNCPCDKCKCQCQCCSHVKVKQKYPGEKDVILCQKELKSLEELLEFIRAGGGNASIDLNTYAYDKEIWEIEFP